MSVWRLMMILRLTIAIIDLFLGLKSGWFVATASSRVGNVTLELTMAEDKINDNTQTI
jgi:hypothetical protein